MPRLRLTDRLDRAYSAVAGGRWRRNSNRRSHSAMRRNCVTLAIDESVADVARASVADRRRRDRRDTGRRASRCQRGGPLPCV